MNFGSKIKRLAGICACLTALCGPSHADITVFAAASLRGALDEIAALSDTPVTLSYAGSGTIARQVSQGAPADVVILAHPRWMDWLAEQGAILPNTRVDVANNSLVLIGPKGAAPLADARDIADRLGQGRLAMGQRDSVPAGIYAREWLTQSGVWDGLKIQLAEVENVRLALALVARNEAPLGVVYNSDAAAQSEVSIVYKVPVGAHSEIKYPTAAVTNKAINFIKLLRSPQAIHLLEKHGFAVPQASK